MHLPNSTNGPSQANLVLIVYASNEGSGEPAHSRSLASSESRGTFKQKTRSLAPLNGWACAVEMCHDGMLEDTNSLDGAQMKRIKSLNSFLAQNVLQLTSFHTFE